MMPDQEVLTAGLETGVNLSEAMDGLSRIHRPGCAAAIWRRQSAPTFQAWIDGLAPEQLPSARVILRREMVRDAMGEICESSATPEGAERQMFIEDVVRLADTFSDLTHAKWLRLRCDVVNSNACRKFHIDAVTARLICTYRGTGTQYGVSVDGTAPTRIYTVPTGSPVVLRGTLWQENPKSGLLHRSPPIEGSGETRLLLVLDPVYDPEEEPGYSALH